MEVGTSEWWISKLSKELDERHHTLDRFDRYYRGVHELEFATAKFRNAFGGQFRAFGDNFLALVVDAVEERLNVEGFRIDDERGDKDAWRIWQSNNLDAESQIAHTESLVKGRSYVLVWASPDGDPEITVEDPLQMVVAYEATNRRRRTAAFKRWIDDSGFLFGTLYLPDRIEKYQSQTKVDAATFSAFTQDVKWEERKVRNEVWPLPNPLGEVPVVSLRNKPRIGVEGASEIETVIPLQDAINKLCADMLVASEFGAFRQRWVTGIEIPTDPDTGKPLEPFRAAIDRVFAVEDEQARFGEFSQTDLAPFVKAIEMFVQHIASITATPPHYLLGQSGQFPSGESLKATETALVARAKRKMRHFGEGWEAVIRLAFMVQDDPRGKVIDSETLWRDPESRTESQHVDSILKMKSLGVPDEALWELLDFTPQQIARYKQIRRENPPEPAKTVSELQ